MSDRCEKHGVTRCMLCRAKNPATAPTVSAELDPQAQAAAARVADTTPVEVDFGRDWKTVEGESVPYSAVVATEAIMDRVMEPLFATEPVPRMAPKGTHLAGNPIVDAAAAYTHAQADVDMAVAHVAELESDLSSARTRLEEVKADRDVKKQVLQALVGGAA